jgi:mono/diheme cytochrome c family protein
VWRIIDRGGNSLKNLSLSIIVFAFVAVFVLASCNTAGELPQSLVTPIIPPPGAVATRSAKPTSASAQPVGTMPPVDIPTAAAPVPVSLPQQQPVAQRGQAVYEADCAACHGATGKGDGPQSQQIVIAMGGKLPNFADAAYARSVKPTDWFSVISNGRLQKGMPPFTSLVADDRWDVVAYLYTLSIPQEQVDKGKTVYTDKCALCHGATGKPDAQSAPGVPDLSDASKMADQSQADLDAVIANGKGAIDRKSVV